MAMKAYRVRNWGKYNKALMQRGSVTFWMNDEVAKNWYETETKCVERGRPKYYSDLAIESCLILRGLFRLHQFLGPKRSEKNIEINSCSLANRE